MLEHGVWARKCHREFLLRVTILVQAANIFMSERFIRRTMVEMNSSMSLTSGRRTRQKKVPEDKDPEIESWWSKFACSDGSMTTRKALDLVRGVAA